MEIVALLVPFGVFTMVTVSVVLLTRLIATGMLNKTIREALRTDPASVPLLADKLEARQPWADSLLGWLFLAFAATIAGLALFEPDDQRELFQAAVVPLVAGITVLLYVHLMRPKTPAA